MVQKLYLHCNEGYISMHLHSIRSTLSLAEANESVWIVTAMVTTVWHVESLRNCDVTGKFSAHGTTTVEIRKEIMSTAVQGCIWNDMCISNVEIFDKHAYRA